MRNYFTQLCNEIDTQIEVLKRNKPTASITPNIIICIEVGLSNLKKYMDDHPFANSDEEVYFFKILKPKIVSKLIYYKKVYQVDLEKPLGSIDQKKFHIKNELDNITKYFLANTFFIQYIRSGKTHFDQKYFIRKNAIEIPINEFYSCEIDYEYGTGYDHRVAIIQAYEMLEISLNQELESLNNPSLPFCNDKNNTYNNTCVNNPLNWTGPQTALVEVIYGLFYTGVFNNGTADIKDIAECFENSFNIEINQLYRTFSSIKNRKNSTLKFIDFMKMTFEKKIEDELNS